MGDRPSIPTPQLNVSRLGRGSNAAQASPAVVEVKATPVHKPAQPEQSPKVEQPATKTVAVAVYSDEPSTEEADHVEIATNQEIDLLKIFPLSFRYSIRKCIVWFLLFLVVIAAHAFLEQRGALSTVFAFDPEMLFYGVAVVLSLKFLYWELYRRCLTFRISGFRFIVTRGIIFKSVGSQPIVPFGELYIMTSVLDLICNTRTLHYHTSLDPTKSFLKFDGLSPSTAKRLHAFLSVFLSQQIALPATEAKAKVGVTKTLPDKRRRVGRRER